MIYVTSDRQEVKDEARKEFGKKNYYDHFLLSIQMDKSFNKIENIYDNNSSLQDMILDLNLLKMWDMTVVSQGCFGFGVI